MKSLGIKTLGILMLLALLGGMFPCESECEQDDHCTQDCGCQVHCAIAIITPEPPFTHGDMTERFSAATPRLTDFSLHSAIFRPPIG